MNFEISNWFRIINLRSNNSLQNNWQQFNQFNFIAQLYNLQFFNLFDAKQYA